MGLHSEEAWKEGRCREVLVPMERQGEEGSRVQAGGDGRTPRRGYLWNNTSTGARLWDLGAERSAPNRLSPRTSRS